MKIIFLSKKIEGHVLKLRIMTFCFLVVSTSTAMAFDASSLDQSFRETSSPSPSSNLSSGQEFSNFYSDISNYGEIYRVVMSWYGTTSNGCVAFASTALRIFGISIPQNGVWNGERLSLLTKPFSSYLENKLGWQRITDRADLEPGDLVFTVDEPKAPGYPAHVFMHAGYADSNRQISLAVDNQGFTHPRALAGDIKKDYSAFAYALRMPD